MHHLFEGRSVTAHSSRVEGPAPPSVLRPFEESFEAFRSLSQPFEAFRSLSEPFGAYRNLSGLVGAILSEDFG